MAMTRDAATILWDHWQHSTHLDALPDACRPRTRADGYAIQSDVARLSGQDVVGWKIAATSVVGQKHINVDGPLAGRLLAHRQKGESDPISLLANVMNVAEAEFAFRLAAPLPVRDAAYTVDEVMAVVDTLHPAIEVPDSRYPAFATVGAPQLIADNACASWFVIGEAAGDGWRDIDLVRHEVTAFRNGQAVGAGSGANVLGDPRVALAWIANELRTFDEGLRAGDVIITGTCLVPVAVAPGDRVQMDFGRLGRVQAVFVD